MHSLNEVVGAIVRIDFQRHHLLKCTAHLLQRADRRHDHGLRGVKHTLHQAVQMPELPGQVVCRQLFKRAGVVLRELFT
jgi:hypothetical protein